MRAVNLLPRDQAQRTIKKESLPVLIGACSGVLVAAAIGSMFMMGSGKVAAQQRKVDDLNRTYQALPPPPAGPSAAQQQLAGEQSARVGALSTALTSRVAWDRVFREFSLVLARGCLAHLTECEVADLAAHERPDGHWLAALPPSSRSRAAPIRTTASPGCSRACRSCRI